MDQSQVANDTMIKDGGDTDGGLIVCFNMDERGGISPSSWGLIDVHKDPTGRESLFADDESRVVRAKCENSQLCLEFMNKKTALAFFQYFHDALSDSTGEK